MGSRRGPGMSRPGAANRGRASACAANTRPVGARVGSKTLHAAMREGLCARRRHARQDATHAQVAMRAKPSCKKTPCIAKNAPVSHSGRQVRFWRIRLSCAAEAVSRPRGRSPPRKRGCRRRLPAIRRPDAVRPSSLSLRPGSACTTKPYTARPKRFFYSRSHSLCAFGDRFRPSGDRSYLSLTRGGAANQPQMEKFPWTGSLRGRASILFRIV
ncbi:hypothetical protein SAMN02799624_05477 [Paenibacillus sp. UNC496MF]|nr:hypothetical protein SAMN02799624_05477 [Paenibacillus sp. UNC496MF]